MAAAEPATDHPPSTNTGSPPAPSPAPAPSPRPASRQSARSNLTDGSDDDAQFWDSQTTAAQSAPASPAASTAASTAATELPSGASQHHNYRHSFYTAVDRSQSSSPPDVPGVELTSPTPLPARLQNERQRWLLSRSTRSTTFPGTYPPSSSASSIASLSSRASESGQSNQTRSPALRSSNGVATSQGPPPALLSRRSQSKDAPQHKSPTSPRTFAQKSLQPLKLLSLRGRHNRQDSATTVTPSAAETLNTDHASTPAAPRSDVLLSPKTKPLAQLLDVRPKSAGHMMAQTSTEEYFEGHGDDYPGPQDVGESGTEGQSSEDIFLNLAQDGTNRHSLQERIEKRRSRIARPGQRQSLPTSTALSQADSSERDSTYGPPSAFENSQRMYSRRPSQIATAGLSSYRDASPASSTGGLSRLEAYKARYYTSQRTPQAVSSGPRSPEIPTYGRRRPSLTDNVSSPNRPQAYRPSKLNTTYRDYETASNADTTPENGRKRAQSRANADGSESVGSGTAPSTMWDELEDLKSRIRRIELTGKTPSTSGAAMQSSTSGSNERPRTATTTVTTISSSPKHNKLNKQNGLAPSDPSTPGETQIGGLSVGRNIHPLLHQALARCKSVLKPDLYRIIEAAASEALELATLSGSAGPQGTTYTAASIINGATVSDRQVRRKADNMCRTLTELCIALCENQESPSRRGTNPDSPAVVQSIEDRPGSRAGPAQTERHMSEEPQSAVMSYARRAVRSASLEPESAGAIELARSSPSRALSRIEARRNSLNVLALSSSANNSPRDVKPSIEPGTPDGDANSTPLQQQHPQQQQQQPQQQRYPGLSRFSRAGTSLLRTRRRVEEESGDEDPATRPLSRAMTDVAGGQTHQLRIPSISRRERQAHRLSREYTSNEPLPEHPLPQQQSQQGQQQLGQSGSLRRATGSNLPQATGRRYADRSTPPVAYESMGSAAVGSGPGSAEDRRQRVSSLGRRSLA